MNLEKYNNDSILSDLDDTKNKVKKAGVESVGSDYEFKAGIFDDPRGEPENADSIFDNLRRKINMAKKYPELRDHKKKIQVRCGDFHYESKRDVIGNREERTRNMRHMDGIYSSEDDDKKGNFYGEDQQVFRVDKSKGKKGKAGGKMRRMNKSMSRK